jgi:hypothetical protein
MYTYEVTPDLFVIVYDAPGSVINNPGPWQSAEEATAWATEFVGGLNDGSIPWPPVEEND